MKLIRFLLAALVLASSANVLAATDTAEMAYQQASKCYHKVKEVPAEDQNRAKWYRCAKLFEEVSRKYSRSKRAPDALFSAGLSYRRIYELTENEDDARDAVSSFSNLVRMYSKNRLADDALFNVATLKWEALGDAKGARNALNRIIGWYPNGDMAAAAEDYLGNVGGSRGATPVIRRQKKSSKPVKLVAIERKKGTADEALVLKLSGAADYKESYGRHSVAHLNKFTLDLNNAYLSRFLDIGYSYTGGGIIRDIIPSQPERGVARVDVVIKEGHHCETRPGESLLEVVCSPGEPVKGSGSSPIVTAAVPKDIATETETEGDVEQGSRPFTVVIDAGHGGDDKGAIGPDGIREKDIVLQIAKRLGWQLRNKLGMDVNYTRIDDRFISLDDRNTIATGFKADLFVSIHANASESDKLDGYQTFFLNNATDEASRRLAARENASMGKSMDDLEQIILTMMQNVNTDESRLLAKSVHKKVLSKMSKYGLKDRGVKSALFYVLVGAKCPAVLIETSFISNPDEERKLKNPQYQEDIVKGIAEGVRAYVAKSKVMKTNL